MTANASDAALWSALPMPALLLDAGDVIRAANPAAEDFLNASARSLLGSGLWDRLAVDAPLADGMRNVRRTGSPLMVSDVDAGAVGRAPLQCSLSVAPVAGQGADLMLLIHPRELAGRLMQGQSAKSAARTALGLAGMLGHEIRNPLAGIAGAAQLLAMTLEPADRELTDLILAETRRIVRLLGRVEQFGNSGPPARRAVNLHDVLDRARRSALLGFGAHMAIIEDYDPSLPEAWADPDQVLQVLLNLMRNAAEAAGPDGGTIRLRSYFEHSFRLRRSDGPDRPLPLQVEVIDDGPGVPEAIRGALFDPFVSGRAAGSGLGLALSAKIVADHEGWLSAESVPGRTVFRLSLPMPPRGAAPAPPEAE